MSEGKGSTVKVDFAGRRNEIESFEQMGDGDCILIAVVDDEHNKYGNGKLMGAKVSEKSVKPVFVVKTKTKLELSKQSKVAGQTAFFQNTESNPACLMVYSLYIDGQVFNAYVDLMDDTQALCFVNMLTKGEFEIMPVDYDYSFADNAQNYPRYLFDCSKPQMQTMQRVYAAMSAMVQFCGTDEPFWSREEYSKKQVEFMLTVGDGKKVWDYINIAKAQKISL